MFRVVFATCLKLSLWSSVSKLSNVEQRFGTAQGVCSFALTFQQQGVENTRVLVSGD